MREKTMSLWLKVYTNKVVFYVIYLPLLLLFIINGECICRKSCHRTGPAVCGTNNVSYPSECHLSIRSCKNTRLNKTEIRVKYQGVCKQQNPCADQRCGPGEECVVSEWNNLLTGRCQCPERCDDYGDSVESSPVCASDGNDYRSRCHLRIHACQVQINITVKFYGKCDPCKDVVCSSGSVCKLNSERKPECRCSEQCSLQRSPVCASDGNT
uniref:Agrin-like n=1 Tax=Syphacia muris TaxID=451379 RepID=A0A0N5B118_9BILA